MSSPDYSFWKNSDDEFPYVLRVPGTKCWITAEDAESLKRQILEWMPDESKTEIARLTKCNEELTNQITALEHRNAVLWNTHQSDRKVAEDQAELIRDLRGQLMLMTAQRDRLADACDRGAKFFASISFDDAGLPALPITADITIAALQFEYETLAALKGTEAPTVKGGE